MEGRKETTQTSPDAVITRDELVEICKSGGPLNWRLKAWSLNEFFFAGDQNVETFIRNFVNAPEYLCEGQHFTQGMSETDVAILKDKKKEANVKIDLIKRQLIEKLNCDDQTASSIINATSQIPSFLIPNLISGATKNEIAALAPLEASYNLYQAEGGIYLQCDVAGFPLTFVDTPDRIRYVIPEKIQTVFKLTFSDNEYGYELVSISKPVDPLLDRILHGEEVGLQAVFTAYSPFALYLNRADVKEKLAENISEAFNANHPSLSLVTRCFNDLKVNYDGISPLITSFFEVIENPKKLNAWLDFASATVVNDLFDEQGNIRKEVYDALNVDDALSQFEEALKQQFIDQKGYALDEAAEKSQAALKSHLFSAYFQEFIGGRISTDYKEKFDLPENDALLGDVFNGIAKVNRDISEINASVVQAINAKLISSAEREDGQLQREMIRHAKLYLGQEVKPRRPKYKKGKGKEKRYSESEEESDSEKLSETTSYQSPFAKFLKQRPNLNENIDEYLVKNAGDGSEHLSGISRCFNGLQGDPYPGVQPLVDLAADAVSKFTSKTKHLDIDKKGLVPALLGALEDTEFETWFYLATAMGLHDLFDKSGNIRNDIKQVLNKDVVIPESKKGKEKDRVSIIDLLEEQYGSDKVKSDLLGAYVTSIVSEHCSASVGILGESHNGDANIVITCDAEDNTPKLQSQPSYIFSILPNEFMRSFTSINSETIEDVDQRLLKALNNRKLASPHLKAAIEDYFYNKAREDLQETIANPAYNENLRTRGQFALNEIDKIKASHTANASNTDLTNCMQRINATIKNPSKETAAHCRKQAKRVAGFPWGNVLGGIMIGLAGAVVTLIAGGLMAASIASIPLTGPVGIGAAVLSGGVGAVGLGTVAGGVTLFSQGVKQEAEQRQLRKTMLDVAKEGIVVTRATTKK